jgi:hypothetical protein
LIVRLITPGGVAAARSTLQQNLFGSDGSTWAEIDPTVRVTVPAVLNGAVVLGGNADLWTANTGYNQDLGIFVSVDGGIDQLLAWKESGGSGGTFSPNAAFVHTVYPITSGTSFVFKLKWKAHRNAAGATIYAAAGPLPGGVFSTTSLVAQTVS